jgi:hypothetical protein
MYTDNECLRCKEQQCRYAFLECSSFHLSVERGHEGSLDAGSMVVESLRGERVCVGAIGRSVRWDVGSVEESTTLCRSAKTRNLLLLQWEMVI